MMNCKSAQKMIKPYLSGTLSDRETEEFLDHIESCQNCFNELELYFSIYRTLENVDEKGIYDFTGKLKQKIRETRLSLRRRYRLQTIRAAFIIMAELAIVFAFWGLVDLPGGYLDKFPPQRKGFIIKTEARNEAQPQIRSNEN